ncbi:12035_t:CDS:2, partial [Funneliformis caledonium]
PSLSFMESYSNRTYYSLYWKTPIEMMLILKKMQGIREIALANIVERYGRVALYTCIALLNVETFSAVGLMMDVGNIGDYATSYICMNLEIKLVFVDDSRPYKVKAKKELEVSIKIIKNMLLLRSGGEEGIDNTEYGSFWCC